MVGAVTDGLDFGTLYEIGAVFLVISVIGLQAGCLYYRLPQGVFEVVCQEMG